MGTIAQRFYHSTTAKDFVVAGEVDIKKLLESAPGTDSTTICTHANAAGTTDITIDPYTNNSTASDIRANCGWAINRLSADGMMSTATAKRVIKAGTWTFVTSVAIPAAGTLTGTLTVSNLYNVYRVDSAGTRTLLFTTTSNTVASATAAGANSGVLTATFSASEILLETNETIHVGILSRMVQVAGAVGATVAGVATYTIGTTIQYVQVAPTGVLTRYFQSLLTTMIGIAKLNRLIILTKGVIAIGISSFNRIIVAFKSFALTTVGISTNIKRISPLVKLTTTIGKSFTYLLLPQSVLNRMSAGGTTTVTTIFAVLD